MANGKSRPILVTVIALLYLLSGILMLVGAVGLFTDSIVIEDADVASLGGTGLLIGAVISLLLFYGFWKGWSVFWYLGVIFTAIGAIAGVVALFTTGPAGIVSLIIDVLILFYLFSSKVKRFFLD